VNSLSERILGNAVLYDGIQRVAGVEKLRQRLSPVLDRLDPGTLLDVGAGTGAFYDLVPHHVRYVPLDADRRKLDRLREKHGNVNGVVASATDLPFDDSSLDYTLCTNVSHHLSDRELDLLIAELARVTRQQLVFLDALRTPRLASRLLWRIDRGSQPRSYEQLVGVLSSRFASRRLEILTYLHTYVLFVGAPLDSSDQVSPPPKRGSRTPI
jgi:SAM-dependent methyltransferase